MLEVSALASYYGRIAALKGISIRVREGELVALVGANGAGKTTLLRAISGVQPVAAGRVLFAGEDITRCAPSARVRKGVVQVPEGRQVFGPLTVLDNLRLGAYTRPRTESARSLENVYGLFPALAERRHHAAGTLSGGQQQMLAMGRALMARPKVLLLDEPSMGLSPIMVDKIFEVVADIHQRGTTVMLVEQNASRALGLADRGYVMDSGEVTMAGDAKALLSDPRVRAAYLGE
jgi:branched-chain amino acid transport system ATP-binding protein